MAYIGRGTDKISNVEVLDNITFDGSSSYTLQKGGSNFTPSSANTLLLSIDGVVQAGNFTVSGSTIDFGTAVAGTSTCDFVLHYGVGLITTPSDGSVTEAKIGTGAVTSAKLASGAVPNQSAFKNIIINGDMSIAQRGTSATGLGNGDSGYYTCDRWQFNEGGSPSAEFTQTQSTDVPSGQGFATSLKMDCTTAQTSLGADEYMYLSQKFEGQNLQYLKKGTSNAESLTLSFWVKSNKTGTYICALRDADNTRWISKTYTISSSSTWEKKTVTFAGDTTGTLNNDNGTSLQAYFYFLAGSDRTSGTLATSWESFTAANIAVGQVNLSDSTSNEWYITGVQLEAGTSASDFEFLPVDVNLDRCLRYFAISARGAGSDTTICNGTMYTASEFYGVLEVGKKMRATPSMSAASGSDTYGVLGDASEDRISSVTIANITNEGVIKCRVNASCSKVQGQAAWLRFAVGADSNDVISADAEL